MSDPKERKDERVTIRISESELSKIRRGAKRNRRDLSKFIRLAALDEAERTEPHESRSPAA